MGAPSIGAAHRLTRLLVEGGLIGEDDVVGGDLVLRDLSRRNPNVLVERRRRPTLFVKTASGAERRGALEREANRYRSLDRAGLASLAPRLLAHDRARGMLVLEGLPGARDLRAVHLGEERFPSKLGALLGDALGALHGAAHRSSGDEPSGGAPWVFTIHRPTVDDLRELHPSSLDLVRVIRREPGIGRRLDDLRARWTAATTIHNDLKWDNVMVVQSARGGPSALRIVDWEHAREGDPLWDVGSAVAGYLGFWVYSIDVRPGVPAAELPSRARFPLESMAPAVGALWSAYCSRRGLDDAGGALAVGAARMAGARLLLAAHEATESGAPVNAHLVLHVQLAANLLLRPHDALERLGLPAAGPHVP
jgi:Ser/Thr protein kinase RdoA (MazF antagonist)